MKVFCCSRRIYYFREIVDIGAAISLHPFDRKHDCFVLQSKKEWIVQRLELSYVRHVRNILLSRNSFKWLKNLPSYHLLIDAGVINFLSFPFWPRNTFLAVLQNIVFTQCSCTECNFGFGTAQSTTCLFCLDRTIGLSMKTLKSSLGKTASQLSTLGRKVTSVDDLVDFHLDLADGTFAGRSVHSITDITLGSEDAGSFMVSFKKHGQYF